ncbi:hypothetical protein FRC03_005771, partial [Tulasnella sp. 419]
VGVLSYATIQAIRSYRRRHRCALISYLPLMAFKILVGSYTAYISALSFDGSNSLSFLTQSPAGFNPSWVTGHPTNKTVIYANNEGASGSVLSFVLNSATGQLTQVDTTSSGGADPAHILALSSGKELYVTNYSGGSGLSIPLGTYPADLPATAGPINQFVGSGPNQDRQLSPHPHQAIEYKNEILVPDLGSDQVWRLAKDSTGKWIQWGNVLQKPGSGPRHGVTLDNYLYTIHELDNTLTQHTLPPVWTKALPVLVKSLSIVPPGTNVTLSGGELLLSPKNSRYYSQYLYATNRNDPHPDGDAIAIFEPNPLKLVGHVRTGLKHIRGAAIGGKYGEYLVAAGKDGGGIVVYKRTNGGKSLVELARYTSVDQPTSIWFF